MPQIAEFTQVTEAHYLGFLHEQESPAIKVLVVEDSGFFRRALNIALRRVGFEVELAADGMEAMAMVQEGKPDLVLLDLFVPKLNGMAFLRLLKGNQKTRNLPVIVVTAHNGTADLDSIAALGANRVLNKASVEFEGLCALLVEAIKTEVAKARAGRA